MKKSTYDFRGLLTRALIAIAGAFALMIAFDPAAASAAPMRFKIDPDRSTITATVAEPAAWIRGSATGAFRIIDGALSFD